MRLDTDLLMETGARGIHLLFETETIAEAYRQDAGHLREALSGRMEEIHFVIAHVIKLRDANAARDYIADLAPALRYMLVLLYFDLLDSRLRQHPTLH
jgi:hypothetical protein